jgi:hypothetical protein
MRPTRAYVYGGAPYRAKTGIPCAMQNGPWCTFYARESRCRYTNRQEWTVVTHPVNHPLHVHQPALRVSEMLSYMTDIAYQGPGLGHKLAG